MITNIKTKLLVHFYRFIAKFTPPPANSVKFCENVKYPIIQRNVNFVGEHSSMAYFINIVTLIKIWIETIALKFLVFILRRGVYWKRPYIVPPAYKTEKSIKISIKWALDECSPTKLTFLCIIWFFTFSPNFKCNAAYLTIIQNSRNFTSLLISLNLTTKKRVDVIK